MRNSRRLALVVSTALLLAGTAVAGLAQTDDPAAPTLLRIAVSAPTTIAEGTPVLVAVKQTLRSGAAKKGDPVLFEVASDVRSPDGRDVLIPKGAPCHGTVEESRSPGAFGRPGTLRVRCDYVLLANGTRVPLRPAASLAARGRSRKGAAVTSGVLVGAGVGYVIFVAEALGDLFQDDKSASPTPLLVGAASGILVSALWRGGNVTLAEGKQLETAVAGDTPLDAATPNAGSPVMP